MLLADLSSHVFQSLSSDHRVELIAGDENDVHRVLLGQAGDLRQDRAVLFGAAVAPDRPAHVPVRGVQQAHQATSASLAPGCVTRRGPVAAVRRTI